MATWPLAWAEVQQGGRREVGQAGAHRRFCRPHRMRVACCFSVHLSKLELVVLPKAAGSPQVQEVRKLLGDECQVCLDELDLNLQAWETQGNALIEEWDLSAPEGASLGFS